MHMTKNAADDLKEKATHVCILSKSPLQFLLISLCCVLLGWEQARVTCQQLYL